jgi:hypothetical protein
VLIRDGFLAAQRKALRRCLQLYVAQIIVFFLASGLFLLCWKSQQLDPADYAFVPLVTQPGRAVFEAMLLMYSPWLMDILKLYVFLLMLLPAGLWLYHRSRVAAFGVSFAVYAVAQKFPEICPQDYFGGRWFWNPFGWQLLFLGAAALGYERTTKDLRLSRKPWLIISALIALVAIMFLRRAEAVPWMWSDRQKLAPMQVASFAIGAYLIAAFLRADWRFWSSWIATPIIRCGRQSLPVFCTTILLDYAVSILFETIRAPLAQVLLLAGAVVLALVVGNVIDLVKTARKSKAAPVSPLRRPRLASPLGETTMEPMPAPEPLATAQREPAVPV